MMSRGRGMSGGEGIPDLPRRPTFVGRQRVTAALHSALQGACSGHGQLVLLVGDAGMGKTRTAEELAALASASGARVLWGSCYAEGAPAFWPWVQALGGYAEAGDDPAASTASELLARLGAGAASPDRSERSGPESDRFRLFDRVASFLHLTARGRPTLVVLDDLHWADRSSLRLLEFVARRLARSRILILGTGRSEESTRPDWHPRRCRWRACGRSEARSDGTTP